MSQETVQVSKRRRIEPGRFCNECGSKWTLKTAWHKGGPKTQILWHVDRRDSSELSDGYLCHKCYQRLVGNPKYNPRRVTYKGKRVLCKENPRKGVCQKCGKSVSKGEITSTDIHHDVYHDDDPLRDTRELCDSCHAGEGVGWQRERERGERRVRPRRGGSRS